MPNGGVKLMNNELIISNYDFARFLGWFISEGHID
jgi:hypothetical protein